MPWPGRWGWTGPWWGPRAIRYARGLELLDLHVPVNLVQKFLGQQKPSQIAAFLNFFRRRRAAHGPEQDPGALVRHGSALQFLSGHRGGHLRGHAHGRGERAHLRRHAPGRAVQHAPVRAYGDPRQPGGHRAGGPGADSALARAGHPQHGQLPALHGAEHPPGPGGVLRLAGTGRRLAPVRHGGERRACSGWASTRARKSTPISRHGPRACAWTDISRKGPPFRTGGASSTDQGVAS